MKEYINKNLKIINADCMEMMKNYCDNYFGSKEFVGIEIDEDYYYNTIKRIKEQTSQIKLL